MKNLGMNPSEDKMDKLFNEIDLDNNGTIDNNQRANIDWNIAHNNKLDAATEYQKATISSTIET